MNEKKYNCFLVKDTEKNLLKFSYNTKFGIYYEKSINGKWQEKEVVYKESFENFYVMEGYDGSINIFCQDVCGDIILCTLEENLWEYKTILYMKHNEITPIEVKAFFSRKKMHFLYNLINEKDDIEMIIHQSCKGLSNWTSSEMLINIDCYSSLNYYISQSYNSCVMLINNIKEGIYKLSSRVFNLYKNLWEKEIVIYISRSPYKDFSFCVLENRSHYLIVTEENDLDILIYQYKDILTDKEIEMQKNIILFEHERIDSCIVLNLDNILWALWISDKKLYGCFSKNNGQDFSNPLVYKSFDNIMPEKANYKEFIHEENKYIDNEIYIFNHNGEVYLFLYELLLPQITLDINNSNKYISCEYISSENNNINYKDIEDKSKNSISKIKEVKGNFTKFEVFNIEKLEEKIKEQNEKIRKLNNDIVNQENQLLSLKYKLNKEKEKVFIINEENNTLKEKKEYLEKKMLLKDKEKLSIESKLVEKNKENEYLKQRINEINSNKKDKSKGEKFSIKKWIFDNKE